MKLTNNTTMSEIMEGYEENKTIEKDLTDAQIIIDAMKIHADKRYNRKQLNARKHLIKDKRSLFKKKDSKVYNLADLTKGLSKVLFDKNVIVNENQNLKIISETSRVEWVTPVKVDINYKRNSIFPWDSELINIKGLFIIHKDFDNNSIILESLTEKEYFSNGFRKITLKNSDIIDMHLIELNHLTFSRKVGRDFYSKDLDYQLNTKRYFYGKPVHKDYCKGIYLGINKRKEDRYFFEEKEKKAKIAKKIALNDLNSGLIQYEEELIEEQNYDIEEFDWNDLDYRSEFYLVKGYEEPTNYWETDLDFYSNDTLEEIQKDYYETDLDFY